MTDVPTTEPTNLVERACAAAMDAAERELGAGGGRLDYIYLGLSASDVPEGELDACTSAAGTDLPEDIGDRARAIVAFLVTEAASTARAIGLDVRIVPLPGPMGQG
jgi:hypothetical protein